MSTPAWGISDLSDRAATAPARGPHPAGARGSRRARALNGYLVRVSRPMMVVTRFNPPPVAERMLRATRPGVNRTLAALSPVPAGTTVRPVVARHRRGPVRGEWVGATGHHGHRLSLREAGTVLYYLHGSGYVICSPRTHRGLVARLAHRSGALAFSLEYRLGPQHRWPAAGDDAIRGYHWLLSQGIDAERIVVAGDSAGGHLALDLLADNQRTGTPQPGGMVLFSPLYDPTFALAVTHQRSGIRDPLIDAVAAQRILRFYTGDAEPDEPRMRIALESSGDLPRTLIQYGGLEVMGLDAITYHRALLDAGADATLQRWPDQGHVFQMFPRLTPESGHAVTAAAHFIADLPGTRTSSAVAGG
ncbi:alpha/beta hydrolase [Gordonia sp. NPDC003376]